MIHLVYVAMLHFVDDLSTPFFREYRSEIIDLLSSRYSTAVKRSIARTRQKSTYHLNYQHTVLLIFLLNSGL